MPHSYLGVTSFTNAISIASGVDSVRLRQVLEAVADVIDGPNGCARTFQPYSATRYFTPRNAQSLLLDEDLIAITSLKSDDGGDGTYAHTWVAGTDYVLGPQIAPSKKQPYTQIDAAQYAPRYGIPVGVQRGMEIVGIWGYWRDLLVLTATVGTGGISSSATTLPLSGVTEIEIGHTLLIESEQLYVTAIGAASCTVERAQNGTAAAAHTLGAAVSLYRYPAPTIEAARLLGTGLFQDPHSPYGADPNPDAAMGDVNAALNRRVFDSRVRAYLDSIGSASVGFA